MNGKKSSIKSMTKTTTKNYKWKREDNGWRDLTSGLLWYDQKFSEGKYTYNEAMNKFGHTVPTREEWEEAETHEIREVADLKHDWYWSASVYSYSRSYAWLFNSHNGSVFGNTRTTTNSVRCVGR